MTRRQKGKHDEVSWEFVKLVGNVRFRLFFGGAQTGTQHGPMAHELHGFYSLLLICELWT